MPVSLREGASRLGLALGPRQLEAFACYYRELVKWNRRINLTAIVQREEVEERHFVDSLSMVLALPQGPAFRGRMMDMGSGGGFPGIPLKLALPEAHLTLVESVAKKAAFLRHLTQALGLEGVEVLVGRAEELAHQPGMRDSFDVVMARAVAELAALVELCLPFAQVGGVVIAQKKGNLRQELERSQRALEILGGEIEKVHPVEILPGDRALVVVRKRASTPERYPRRPGVPVRRPL